MRKGAGLGMEAGARAAVLGASLWLRMKKRGGVEGTGEGKREKREHSRERSPPLERVRRLSPGTLI